MEDQSCTVWLPSEEELLSGQFVLMDNLVLYSAVTANVSHFKVGNRGYWLSKKKLMNSEEVKH